MFPKGPRFVVPKIPDFPGPNAYKIPQESHLDVYKRGAFLEKTDRFGKDKPSEGGHADEHRPGSAMSMTVDRYAILQRKLDDLERVHIESKKSSQTEIDQLKVDLARLRKQTADQADRLDKQKKTNDALEGRLQELKKTASNDQAEIRDLRSKLRMAEAGEAKAAEAKRREEGREREKKLAELEKALTGEKRKRQALEAQLEEMKTNSEQELLKARARADRLQSQVHAAQAETLDACTVKQGLEMSRAELISQLDQYRNLLCRTAKEYGDLASSSVSCGSHAKLKKETVALRMHVLRLERKLANAEVQATELANLVRYYTEENESLHEMVRNGMEEVQFHISIFQDREAEKKSEARRLGEDLADAEGEFLIDTALLRKSRAQELEASNEFYRSACNDLVSLCELADKIASVDMAVVEQASVELSDALASRESFVAQMEAATIARDEAQAQLAESAEKLAQTEMRMKEEEREKEKERDVVLRLTGTIHKCKLVEDGLRAETEELRSELREAERFQTAYYSLSDEVEALVARNALAEEEAERLSKFNAEILGHSNPAQKILYVERIRVQLAETKQRLAVTTKRKEAVEAGNEELRHELDMYKSVMVPAECKPRTNITRIGRVPLATQSLNACVEGESEAKVAIHKVRGGGREAMTLSDLT